MLHSLDNTLGPCFKEHHWHIQKKSLLHCIVFLKVLRLLLYLYCFASSHKIRQKKPVCWLPHGKILWPLPVWGPSSVHPHRYSIPILTPPQPRTPASLSPQHSSLAPAPPGCFQGNSAMSQQNEGKKKPNTSLSRDPPFPLPSSAGTRRRESPPTPARRGAHAAPSPAGSGDAEPPPPARPAKPRGATGDSPGSAASRCRAGHKAGRCFLHPTPPQAHSAVKAFPKTLFRLSFSRTKVREARAAPQRRSRRALSHGSRVGSVRGSPAAPRPPADKAPGPPGSGRAAANKGSSGAAGRGGAAPPARER